VLASIGAYFVLRSIKSSAANALTKALEDAAKIAAAEKDAAVAQLKADLNNANENLQKAEDALKNAKTDAQESVIKAKSEAEERYIKQLDEYKNAQKEANEKLEALHNQALKTMKEQLETKTRDMLKERQDEFAKTSKEKLESLLNPFKTDLENMKKSVENNQKEQIELK
jgi:DNA anti-recombination protein RmuC